jgi:hypothetical protein
MIMRSKMGQIAKESFLGGSEENNENLSRDK